MKLMNVGQVQIVSASSERGMANVDIVTIRRKERSVKVDLWRMYDRPIPDPPCEVSLQPRKIESIIFPTRAVVTEPMDYDCRSWRVELPEIGGKQTASNGVKSIEIAPINGEGIWVDWRDDPDDCGEDVNEAYQAKHEIWWPLYFSRIFLNRVSPGTPHHRIRSHVVRAFDERFAAAGRAVLDAEYEEAQT